MIFRIIICFCFVLNKGILGKNIRIIGGTEAKIINFPHMVSIRYVDTNELICGGSIVTKWNILTAAHCLIGLNNNYLNVRIYSGTSSSILTTGPIFEIEHVIFHNKYREIFDPTGILPWDICIIQLKQPIQFNEFQNKINLPTKSLSTGIRAVYVGWGIKELDSKDTSNELRKASQTIYDTQDCSRQTSFSMMIFDDQFCTFNNYGIGICDGDSGGSVIFNQELHGIITDTFQCAMGLPDVHTKVYSHLDFIQQYIKN